jgi:hypothetical protein
VWRERDDDISPIDEKRRDTNYQNINTHTSSPKQQQQHIYYLFLYFEVYSIPMNFRTEFFQGGKCACP